jgi:hypothetical protein
MAEEFLSIPGERVAPDALTIEKARVVSSFLLSETHPWARLVECFRADGREAVVMELSVEVGQAPVHAIQPLEPIAAIFSAADETIRRYCLFALTFRAFRT